jgi:acyl carrier protein phosphodiesterase
MNHLAHCFLSFDDEDVLVGNFIGDFVKGSQWKAYPEAVQRGILLHRAIDSFTDRHPMTDRSVERLRPFAGRWSPPFVDILYDHLLARSWSRHAGEPFEVFAEKTYRSLEKHAADMPPVLQERVPKMVAGRFLHGYQLRGGVEWVLGSFRRRLPNDVDVVALGKFFFDEVEAFAEDFDAFFPDLVEEAKRALTESLTPRV